MKHVIEAFSAIIYISMTLFVSVAIISASLDITAAAQYRADVTAELENSNFNQEVIDACIAQADAKGYMLEITDCTYDNYNDINTAEVVLTYKYEIPLLGISVTKTTRGIAR